MDFEKEVGYLENLVYFFEDEKEVVLEFCNSLKTGDEKIIAQGYYNYLLYQRPISVCGRDYNLDASEIINNIYSRLSPEAKRNRSDFIL